MRDFVQSVPTAYSGSMRTCAATYCNQLGSVLTDALLRGEFIGGITSVSARDGSEYVSVRRAGSMSAAIALLLKRMEIIG